MNDKELADALVRDGVLETGKMPEPHQGEVWILGGRLDPHGVIFLTDYSAINDWRVAGKCLEALAASGRYVDIYNTWTHYGDPNKESLPRAIIEAYVMAMEGE